MSSVHAHGFDRAPRINTGWHFKPTAEYPTVNSIFEWSAPIPGAPKAQPFGDLSDIPIVAIPSDALSETELVDLAKALEQTGRNAHILTAGYAPDPSGEEEYERHKFLQGHSGRLFHGKIDGKPAAWTLDNPPGYNTLGGDLQHYTAFMVTEPIYPDFVSKSEAKAYDRNVLTWQALASISPFSDQDFNGRDNVATISRSAVEEAAMMILAAQAGAPEAVEWVNAVPNQTYCAELVHLAENAGDFPLNKRTLDRFEAKLNARGIAVSGLYDKIADLVESGELAESTETVCPGFLTQALGMAPDELRPIRERLLETGVVPPDLAFGYWTMVDMVSAFVGRHVPRPDPRDPSIAAIQVAVLEQLKGELTSSLDLSPEQEAAFNTTLWPQIVGVIGNTNFPGARSKEEARAMFDAQLSALADATRATGLGAVDAQGYGAFTPPHMYTVKATEPRVHAGIPNASPEFPTGGYLGIRPVLLVFRDNAPWMERDATPAAPADA
ncbi:MAG: hypothetical protein H6729_11015 [Deltaproteobacteria bacterium]|nr:hypothetical protein [Deltaproteobacteria bacterium]